MLSPVQIATPDAQAERSAFNAAFYDLGLRWHWDQHAYDALCAVPCERQRVQNYLRAEQAHLLRAYDAEFLTNAILEAKERRQQAMAQCAARSTSRGFDWAGALAAETGF